MIFYQNRDRQYEKPCSGYPNKEEKTYKPFVVPQKDTEHYFQAFKSYNIPELSENPLSFSAVKIRQVHEKVPAEPFKKFRPNLLNDSLVLTIIITELFRSHSFFLFKDTVEIG